MINSYKSSNMQLFALAYLAAGLIAGAVVHPIAGLAVLATPVAASKLG